MLSVVVYSLFLIFICALCAFFSKFLLSQIFGVSSCNIIFVFVFFASVVISIKIFDRFFSSTKRRK